ncbi:hypothetical protein DET49_104114 [Salegentibacter sp. 24]|uniref:hypothetical protein n=1 Tax=Salegentibacter sp. 24 TaxID=2183986 RepID=UPI00105BC7E9|nr:hypothetical protein [Salegentibacter sp. 24]TDN93388.1 hypothetical protein DET49_104114 [Salegentibacter sp. 24]
MYRGFNLEIDQKFKTGKYHETGLGIYKILKDHVQPSLNNYLLDNGSLDGDKIMADWFPDIECHIFLSHSHKDLDTALYIAGLLYHRFEIIVFLDSTVWGYSGDLLKKIDNKYCYNENSDTYDYNSRNFSTSHVHMMLSTALNNMIDKTECIIFLNTPNSVSANEKTFSPWIFSELNTSRIIRKKTPSRLQTQFKMFSDRSVLSESKRSELQIEYQLELSHLVKLSLQDLLAWTNQSQFQKEKALDNLYRMKPLNQKFRND